jgi:hypothetical protein
MKDYDVWDKYQADKAADKKAKEQAKYEAGKRALDSKYDQQKKSEEIAKAAKIKMAKDAVESHRRAGNLAGGTPQYVKDNEARIKAYEAKEKDKKPKAKAEYKMPKSTTPDMDTSQGTYGSASGESGPSMGRVIKAEKAETAPIEERSWSSEEVSTPKEESRFSSSNPMGMKKGGKVSSASRRADGCAIRGKTRA